MDGSPVHYRCKVASTLQLDCVTGFLLRGSLFDLESSLHPFRRPSFDVDELRVWQFLRQSRARFRASSTELADHVHFPVGVRFESSLFRCVHDGSQRHVRRTRHVSFRVFGRFSHVHDHHVLSCTDLLLEVLHGGFAESTGRIAACACFPERHLGSGLQVRTAHERARSRVQRTCDEGEAHGRRTCVSFVGKMWRLATKPASEIHPNLLFLPNAVRRKRRFRPASVQTRSMDGPNAVFRWIGSYGIRPGYGNPPSSGTIPPRSMHGHSAVFVRSFGVSEDPIPPRSMHGLCSVHP